MRSGTCLLVEYVYTHTHTHSHTHRKEIIYVYVCMYIYIYIVHTYCVLTNPPIPSSRTKDFILVRSIFFLLHKRATYVCIYVVCMYVCMNVIYIHVTS